MDLIELDLSEVRDKYFYRTEKWDWLTNEMIHVFDSKSPRIITMDPWPQEVFLDAIGQKTVGEYIQDVFYRYQNGQAPEGLDKFIVEVLSGLVVEEQIVKLSDIPVKLDDVILKPLRDHGEVDMMGTWTGKYTYEIPDEYKDDRVKEVEFTIEITRVKAQTFTGTVQDNLKAGGTPGVGKITGHFTKNQITFDKNMPVHCQVDGKGNRVIDEKRKHPTILYEGAFASGKQFCFGTWRFKKKKLVWKGVIPFWVSRGHGRFTMEKVAAQAD